MWPQRACSHHAKYSALFQVDIKYVAAYGSGKDVSIYRDMGLQAQQIFIVGKASKKLYSQAQVGLVGKATLRHR